LTTWFLTTKNRESHQFLCIQVACGILSESSRQRLQLASNLISIEGLDTKLWTAKVTKISTLGISKLPSGNPGTKCHLDASPMAKHRIYYKGEGVAFPPSPNRSESCEFEFARDSSVHPKCSNYAVTNLLFGLYKPRWMIEVLINILSPILELQHTLLPPKCYEPRSMPQLPTFPFFSP